MQLPNLNLFFRNCRSWLESKRATVSSSDSGCDYSLPRLSEMKTVATAYLDGLSLSNELEVVKLKAILDSLAPLDRGVYYEGAAAGKAISDLSKNPDIREAMALIEAIPDYSFVLYMGIGEAMAQLEVAPMSFGSFKDEKWAGQIVEGYGFFNGYFRWFDTLVRQTYPVGLLPDLRDAYDQGLGRAIYFIANGQPYKIRDYIGNFAPERQKELWAGLGQSAAYVGGSSESELRKLLYLASHNRVELMQGVLLGVSARIQQKFVPEHTDAARSIICGIANPKEIIVNSHVHELVLNREEYSLMNWQRAVRSSIKREFTSACF